MTGRNGTGRAAAVRILLAVLLLVLLGAGSALADSGAFFVSPSGKPGLRAIGLTAVNGRYYLFLPGNTEKSELKIGLEAGTEAVLNGRPVAGGETAADLLEENVILINRQRYAFRVMQGSSGLPALYVTTETGSLKKIWQSKKHKESGALAMTDGTGKVIYDGLLEHIKMRGNASTTYPKKNYQIKLAQSTDLLGMGKAKKWILTGNWLDRSLIRNEMTFDLAEFIGMPFTPKRQQAELYINGEYYGLYLFMEKVEIGKSRIAVRDLEKETEKINGGDLSVFPRKTRRISEDASVKAYSIPNDPEDITGGYLLEYEYIKGKYDAEPSGFRTERGIGVVIKSPEYASTAQAEYIRHFMQGFENAIFAADGIDPETGKHYYDFVDMDSLARKYMINEFSQNYDGNSSSEFFWKPADSESEKAYAGPVWDLDNTYADYVQPYNRQQLLSPKYLYVGEASRTRYWWPNLYKHAEFKGTVQDIYEQVFGRGIRIILGEEKDPKGMLRSLDDYAAAIEDSAAMTLVRFPYNPGSVDTGRNLADNIEYLRKFIRERTEYLEEAWFLIPE